MYKKPEFESPKYKYQTTFETSKYPQQTMFCTNYLVENVKHVPSIKETKMIPFWPSFSNKN